MSLVTIIMGSEKNLPFCQKIANVLDLFDVSYSYRVGSAHKTPEHLLTVLREEKHPQVYITVAGRSHALSGFVDAHTTKPVIACPVYSEEYGAVDVFSSLRMPSGIASMTILEPDAAALAAVKIIALTDPLLALKVETYQNQLKESIKEADGRLRK